jgi:hypothetical protein
MDMKSGGMKMDQMDPFTHAMVSPDIETLNYSMLKAPQITTKELQFTRTAF